MPEWTFRTPSVDEGPAVPGNALMRFFKVARGITILNNGGTYTAVRYPTEDEIAAPTVAYIGGHEYVVDDATKAALIAAGVGVTEANFTAL